ncbi:MAG: DHH family phosphoesterase [Mariniblastus sp.]|nr:DHH family phosphoesterase [Mariniblastus sp.]
MNVDWPRFVEVIQKANNIVLTSHIRPDCDALGSELGMAGVLRALGKNVRIVNGQETPENLAFIDPENEIKCIHQNITPQDIAEIDLHMILDTSAWIQLGPMADVIRDSSCKKIIFDHHQGEDDIDAELFKNTNAEAVGRMVVEAAEHLGVVLTPEISMPLFAAVSTDTGWFRFPSVSDVTYEIAAKLVRGGAVPSEVYGNLYERETAGRIRLRGVVLSRIQVEMTGRLASTYILEEDYEKTGAEPTDTEDLINLALQIEGTKFAVIMIEQPTGGFKMSFRSRCGIACNEVAAHFGGGGHKAAAGAFIDQPFEVVKKQVLDYVRHCMETEFSTSVE